jgi:peptide deformylase
MKIYKFPNRVLELAAPEITELTSDISSTISEVISFASAHKLTALNGVAIGEKLRFTVLRSDISTVTSAKYEVFINPEIVEYITAIESAEAETSIVMPAPYMPEITRLSNIKVKYRDIHFKECFITPRGRFSRRLQQEIDALNGITLLDRSLIEGNSGIYQNSLVASWEKSVLCPTNNFFPLRAITEDKEKDVE